jgi:hypothetical protein
MDENITQSKENQSFGAVVDCMDPKALALPPKYY